MAKGFHVSAIKTAKRKTIHIRVTRLREMRFRVWLASRLVLAAAWIMPCRVVIEGVSDG